MPVLNTYELLRDKSSRALLSKWNTLELAQAIKAKHYKGIPRHCNTSKIKLNLPKDTTLADIGELVSNLILAGFQSVKVNAYDFKSKKVSIIVDTL